MLSHILDGRGIRPLVRPHHVLLAAAVLMAIDVGARLLPHAPNATPVAASAIFAGFLLKKRLGAMLIPLGAMPIGDLLIGTYDWRIMASVYLSVAVPALAGPFGRSAFGGGILAAAALGGSLLFFLITNAAVWAFGGMYAPGLDGLLQCYISGLPFLKYTVIGDLTWTMAFFVFYKTISATIVAVAKPGRILA